MKTCTKCSVSKCEDEFYLWGGGRPGRRPDCKSCCLARRRKRPRVYSYSEADRQRKAQYYVENRDRISSSNAAWSKANATLVRNKHLKRRYGITSDEVDSLLSNQGGCCAICGTSDPGGRHNQWHVDHSHVTGNIRGILCGSCNTALGLLKDSRTSLLRAVEYLEKNA